jgi:putative peptidoglycan lipid II flippase
VPEPEGRLARSAGLAGAATFTSRILGLARDQVLAALFGAGNQMDAYVIAFRIPNLVRDLFAEGAMSAAFVPTFAQQLTVRGKPAAWRLANSVINALLVTTFVLVAFGFVFAGPIVTLFAGSFAEVPGKLELTIRLTRTMLPFVTLTALAAAMMGMLNSLHHYFVPALSPAAFNVAIIGCALMLGPLMPAFGLPAIVAIAIGAIAGGIGQIALQWAPLRREGFRWQPVLALSDPGLRRVLILMGPGTVGLAATQVNLLVNTVLATGEGTGAASWLTYAFRLMYLPIGLFSVSIATAVLPAAARHVALGDLQAVRATVSRGLSLMLIFSIPATLGLMGLAVPIVRLIFERGAFLASDTASTAGALQFYAIGLVGYSTARIASPVFYALNRSHVPVAISVGAIALNIATSLVLVRIMGFRGLALSTAMAALAHGGAALLLLRGELGGIGERALGATAAKVLAAALVMLGAAVAVERGMTAVLPGDGVVVDIVRVGSAILVGLGVLALAAKALHIREFTEAIGTLRGRTPYPFSG